MSKEDDSDQESIQRRFEEMKDIPVRIALFGQPGSGKSSIINAIIGDEKAKVGVATDTTQASEEYEWQGLHLCDLPGYGTTRFPTKGYFEQFEITKYDLFLCIFEGKLTGADVEFYRKLSQLNKQCIFVRNKKDTLFQHGHTIEELEKEITLDVRGLTDYTEQIIFTSCRTEEGLPQLIDAIKDRLSGVKRDKFIRSAKAYTGDFIEQKREACLRYAYVAAGAAALVNLVPVPGMGIAADLSAVTALLIAVRRSFHLGNMGRLEEMASLYPTIGPAAEIVIKATAQGGAEWLLARGGAMLAAAGASEFVPLVGQAIAASLSFGTIYYMARTYIEQCSKVAEAALMNHFDLGDFVP